MNTERLCIQVCDLAKKAGAFIRQERRTFSTVDVKYKGSNDLVSYVDKETESMLVNGLSRILPDSGFITEENTSTVKGKSFTWIIDPLDGTTNFVHGIPCYCISIALMSGDEIVIGVIYEVNLDECFYAFKNGGAYLNGNKISVSTTDKLKESLIATGFPYSDYSRLKEYMTLFNHLLYNTHGVRRLGSAAVDLAYVACGRFEGFYEYGLNSWDVTAGAFIVMEAGGKVSDFSGGNKFIFGREIVACNSNVFEELQGLIFEMFGE